MLYVAPPRPSSPGCEQTIRRAAGPRTPHVSLTQLRLDGDARRRAGLSPSRKRQRCGRRKNRDRAQSVIVTDRLAVATVPPALLRSVIVNVAEPARSARICQATDCVPPAGTVGTAWLVL